MPASNRATLIAKLNTALKKRYKSAPVQPSRPLLEHLLYGSLLENSPADLADEGMAKCEQEFFDWNEVRVTTVTELAQVLSRLPDPMDAAERMKSNLQSIFEEFYTFDLDHMKKENLGKAVHKFEKMPGMTPFVLSYTIQHGLGGHSIPVDYSAMIIMLATEIASQPEAMAGKVPGLERAIPKSKGIEFSGLLHQAAVALHKSTKDKTARSLLDAVSKGSSDRLDQWLASKKAAKKRAVKRKIADKEAAIEARKAAAAAAKAAAKTPAKRKKTAKPTAVLPKPAPTAKPLKKEPAKKAVAKTSRPPVKTGPKKRVVAQKPAATKKGVTKKATSKHAATKKATVRKAIAKLPAAKKKVPAKKKFAKKPATPKKATKKPVSKKSSKKSVNRKLTKRKPR